jgi:hypothetical protein
MKKISVSKMENLVAGGEARKCFLLGALTFASMALGPAALLASAMYTVAECA